MVNIYLLEYVSMNDSSMNLSKTDLAKLEEMQDALTANTLRTKLRPLSFFRGFPKPPALQVTS
jgi:hypothetical protein